MAGPGDGRGQRTDPAAQLQRFITDWERRADAVANRFMGTDEFSRSANALHRVQLGMQRAFRDAMAAHLNNFNMPSRADITELGETLVALDRRMARMEAMLARLVDPPDAPAAPRRKGPPRTRKPPSARGAGRQQGASS